MAFKQISVKEAHDILEEDPNAIYIDVRTVREFTAGHPEGAVNISVAFPNPGGMTLNEDFELVVGCQVGPRADAAARLLGDAGYKDVSSVQGGFGGMRAPSGEVIAEGWLGLGYPVSKENGEGISYDSLAAKLK